MVGSLSCTVVRCHKRTHDRMRDRERKKERDGKGKRGERKVIRKRRQILMEKFAGDRSRDRPRGCRASMPNQL